MALSCTTPQRAETEIQSLEPLGSVLAGLPPVNIIIDVKAVSPRLTSLDAAVSWPTAFLDFFEKLANQTCKTVVKVVLVNKLWLLGVCRNVDRKPAGSHRLGRTRAGHSYDGKGENGLATRFLDDGERGFGRARARGLAFRRWRLGPPAVRQTQSLTSKLKLMCRPLSAVLKIVDVRSQWCRVAKSRLPRQQI